MKKEIPTIESLISGNIDLNDLQKLLESEPPKEWLQDLEVTQNKGKKIIKYLPIERVDYLLRSIYSDNWCEILSTGIYQTSCQVTLRLFVVNPIDEKIYHVDGVGGASSVGGVDIALALAKANAKKNASKELGKIFGRDLSRETEIKPTEKTNETDPQKEEENHVKKGIVLQLKRLKTKKGLINCINQFIKRCEAGEVEITDNEINLLIKAQCKKYEVKFDLNNL